MSEAAEQHGGNISDQHGYLRTATKFPSKSSSTTATSSKRMDAQGQVASPKEATTSLTPPMPKPNSPRCRPASRAQHILAPRAYEEIYHEQAYLGTYLQQKTARMERLIREYSEADAQLSLGAEGKTRRRLRKLLHLLQCKINETSEQERAIFSRIGELYMELNSRNTWERTRQQQQSMATAMQNNVAAVGAWWPAGMAVPAFDQQGSTTWTPSPSLDPGEMSATSSWAADSPVFFPSRDMAKAQAQQGHSGEPMLPRFGSSEQLETVPEDAREEVPLPRVQPDCTTESEDVEGVHRTRTQGAYSGGEDNFDHVDRTPMQGDFATRQGAIAQVHADTDATKPDLGTLDYEYTSSQGDCTDEEDYAGSEEDGDAVVTTGAREKAKKRWSLPVMRFTWPDT